VQYGQHLERRVGRRLVGHDVVRHAEELGDACAVAVVPVEQLHDGRRLAERAHALERVLVQYGIDHPHATARLDGMRGALHERGLGRDPLDVAHPDDVTG
jgi:hypothetical protein